jgi:opacity protein-like surface antigen
MDIKPWRGVMKRIAFCVLAVLSLAGVGGLSAQQGIRVGIGGGVQLPTGDYGNFDKMGWLIGGDVTYWLTGAPVGIRADVEYAQTSHKNNVDGNSKVIGGLAEVVYAFGTQADQLRPYILGGVGYYNVKVEVTGFPSASESKVGFGGGAGVAFKVGTGSTRVFIEGKFVSVSTSGSSTTFFPLRAGLRFGSK